MANNCSVDMRVTGKAKNIKELIQMLQWKGEYEDDGLGRVFDCSYDEYEFEAANDEDIIRVDLFLDVAWSILSSMRRDGCRPRSLESESERLNLVVEAYSSEPGCQFQEHVLIDRGSILIDDCVEYKEYWVQEFDTIEEFNAEYNKDFTEDMVNDNGDVCIGGFENYGSFEYFSDEHFGVTAEKILTPLICKCCGAPLQYDNSTGKAHCEYCGVLYLTKQND